MPYSNKSNILFIHIPKCAGKSFEVALGISSQKEVEKYTWRTFPNKVSKYFLKLTSDHKAFPRLWGVGDVSLTLQHLTYAEIELLQLIDKKIIDSSIKVAIVRNPFDRCVSSYKHMGGENQSFKDFLMTYYSSPNRNHNDLAHKRPQIDYLRDKSGKIVIDNIIYFENLNNEFLQFKNKYNIKALDLPHIGKQKRKLSYQKYYCDESKEIVETLFKEDIDQFNYTF